MYIADMHCDTIMKLWFAKLRGERFSLRDSSQSPEPLQIDLTKLKKGGALVQNFALFADLKLPFDFNGKETEISLMKNSTCNAYMDPWTQFSEMVKIYHSEIAKNSDIIKEARSYKDICDNTDKGVMSSVLTIEEGGVLGGDLNRLQKVYDEGVRMITLTWNYENELGYPNKPAVNTFSDMYNFTPRKDNGLKAKGIEFVKMMEDLGIIPDVSHLSDAGFYDVANNVKGPFVASHSNARAVCGIYRNLTDDMIKTVADHGGVIGLNFCPAFVEEADCEEHCRCTVDGLVRHAKHIINVGGNNVIGLGTDFDGIAWNNLEIDDASQMQELVKGLEKAGFGDDQIENICYKNVLNVYKEVLRG